MSGKRSGKKSSIKKKSLYDHINQVTSVQNPDYWEQISEEDKKTWSNYMVNRFLSMKLEWVELVNELQKYNLEPKELYKLYTNVLPKGKQWLKYTKGRNNMDYPEWLINIVRNKDECSRKEAKEAIDMLMLTEGGMMELGELGRKWGIEERRIKEAGLNVVDNMNRVILDEEKDPKLQKKLKESVSRKNQKVSKNKDGGLMEAIKRVDAEKEKRLKDGGMIGNLTSNFKGYY